MLKGNFRLFQKFKLIIIYGLIMISFSGVSFAEIVVVYTSVDQIFSEPVFKAFENQTGIKLKAVYDVEASKTTGLVNRLIAEKRRPKCDVFWNSEIGKTIVLQKKGILTPYASPSAINIPDQFKDKEYHWTGFGARARVLIYNTKLLKENEVPKSLFELTNIKWRGKVAMAYPLFGTSATHMAALFTLLGKEKTQTYLEALKANDVVVVDGNSIVRDLVVQGEVPLGITDTDDVNVAIGAGKSVKMVYPDQNGMGTLFIPNTVALIKDAPHPDTGKRFIDYLLSEDVESRLSFSESAQMPLRDHIKTPNHIPVFGSITPMKVNFLSVAENMEPSARFCQHLFIR